MKMVGWKLLNKVGIYKTIAYIWCLVSNAAVSQTNKLPSVWNYEIVSEKQAIKWHQSNSLVKNRAQDTTT